MIRGRMIYVGGPLAMKRGWPKIMKEALSEAAGLWHRRYLPEHFRPGASSKYGYADRSAAYVDRKSRRRSRPLLRRKSRRNKTRTGPGVGGPAPRKRDPNALVFRGDLKRELTRRAVLSGSSKRVRVVMDVGGAWYGAARFLRRPNAPNMPSEITAITPAEERRIVKIIEQFAARKLESIKTQETRT